MSAVILESVLICPHCGFAKQEAMDAVVRFNLSLFGLSNAPNAPQAVVMGGRYDVESRADARGGLPDYHP
jgi:hypothetical protein